MYSCAPAAARIWASSFSIAVWLGLCVMGTAGAVEIPPLSDLPPAITTANPELVKQRETLAQERETLGARARSHNLTCRAVEKDSAADTICIQALATLTSAINSHIQARKQFNDNLHTAINLAARLNPTPDSKTSMVNAVNVPSGLPKSLENAIATAYSDAPPGVSDRVRKGFQAVMDRDWKVAKAWFEDALKLNPGHAGLKRLVALADSSQQSNKQLPTVDARNEPSSLGGTSDFTGAIPSPSHSKPVSEAAHTQLREKDSIYLLFPDLKAMDDAQVLEFLSRLNAQPPSLKSGKVP